MTKVVCLSNSPSSFVRLEYYGMQKSLNLKYISFWLTTWPQTIDEAFLNF